MNEWHIRKTAIVEADDFQDKFDRNGLNFLFYWKTKYPKFKITLFTIPDKTSDLLLKLVFAHRDWIELAVHGWNHESNFECYGWDYDKTQTLMERVTSKTDQYYVTKYYKKIFKAPGWTIYPGLNGYPSAPEDLITKDPLGVYKGLIDKDFIIVDRHYNKSVRPAGNYVCVDCQPNLVHMHTWNMMGVDEAGRNGFEQVETRGVPWDNDTEFFFMSEAWEKGLYVDCKD